MERSRLMRSGSLELLEYGRDECGIFALGLYLLLPSWHEIFARKWDR